MKKLFTIMTVSLIGTASAQTPTITSAESAPVSSSFKPVASEKAAWDLLFSYDITAGGAGVGNAAVVPFGSSYWTARWANDSIFELNSTGIVTSDFVISGVSGVRSFTTDGTYIYAGTNSSSIYKIDPVTKTLVSTINVASVPNIRYCSYDATANSNAGGFWVGTWATDITLVDMTGNVLSSIPAATHTLTSSYGLACDGGAYLWSFHQTGTTSSAELIQIDKATGVLTAVIHDVTADMGVAGDLAGGVYVKSSPKTIYGIIQGTVNFMFSYDIVGVVGVEELEQSEFVKVYPNPSNQTVNVKVNRTNNDPMQIQIINSVGQVVSSSENVGENNIYNIEKLASGIYSVQVTSNGKVYSSKLVVE